MRKFYFLLVFFFIIECGWGQTSTQDFGSSTGSHTSQTGSAAFIPNPTSGTTWARAGATAPNAPVNLVTASNPLGTTGAYVRAVASSSTSVCKFSPWVGYTSSTEFYTSFKVLFGDASAGNTATSGIWSFYQGAGTMYSDASDFSGAQVFTGLRFTYGASGAISLTYRGGGSFVTTGLTNTNFSSATVYTVEIVGNNKTSGTINYLYNGGSQSVAVQKFDLYINGVLIGDDLAEAIMPANTAIASGTFIGISSTSNVANIFVDDAITYNAVPASIGVPPTPTTTSISPNSATEGGSGFTLTVNGTNFINGLSTVRWNGSNRTTGFNNSTQLTATINAADIASAGTATVDVITSGAAATSNTQTFTINSASSPLITLTPTSLSGFTYVAGAGPSGIQSFSVSGVNLTSPPGNLVVTAPSDYEINDGNGWVTTFNIPYASGTLGPTNIDVRLKSGLAVGNYNNELISVVGGGDTKNETVSGSVTLGTPVANSPTVFTPNSFTAIWSTVAGATAGYLLDASAFSSFTTTGTVANEGFENLLTLFTETTGSGSFSSGNSTSSDAPSTSPFASAGTYAYGKANGSVTITSSNINTSSASGVQLSFRLASFSIGSLANGADAGDIVTVEISPDGGTTYYSTVRVLGNSNAVWAYAATGTASTAYDGNATPVDFTPAGGGTRTTDGYSTVVITNLPSVSNLKIRITLLNNNTAELWLIDDLAVTGLVGSFLTGYNSLPVVGTSQSVTVPGAGTYYFRVRATTGSVISANSNVVAVTMNDQSTATFKSNNSGDYNNTASWLYNVSGSTYIGATQLPANTNDVIIQSGHTLTLSASASANAFTMNTSSGIDLNGNTLSVNGDMVNNGNLFINSGTVDFTKAAGTQILTTGGTGAGKTFYMLSHSGAGTLQLATNGLKVVNNMTNNAGPFSGNGLNVNVGGNLTVNGSYSSGGGTLTFDGSANQNWSGNGSNDYGDVVINKSSGNAVLGSTVQVNNLTLSSGKLVLGSNNFIVGGSVSGGSSSNYIVTDGTGALTVNNIGVPAKTLPIGNSKYNPVTIANGSGHNWTARLEDAVNNVNPPFNTNKAVLRTWTITPSTNPPAAGADLTFQYDDGDPSQLGPSFNTAEDVQLWHYNVAWIAASSAMTPTGSPGSVRTITKTGWSLYSSFAIANQSGPLPVSLVSFSGYKDGTRNQLRWTTANEQNNRGFDIQRSADGVNYSSIGFINTQAVGGTSSDMLNYAFTDLSPAGSRQYYRLRQEDIDGRSKLSNIVLIRGDKPVSLSIDGLFPNPANTVVNVLIAAPGRDQVKVIITDMAGRTMLQKQVSVETGANTVPVDISKLTNGTYLVKLVCTHDCETVTGKFVKQ